VVYRYRGGDEVGGVGRDTFRQIFEEHWSEFKKYHPFYASEYYDEVVRKMLGCGKEAGGYSEYVCTGCGKDLRRVCFTCKSSFCLSCAKGYTEGFVEEVSRVLQPGVRYRHMILTVPEQLRIHFYGDRQKGGLLSALMRCGCECLEDVVGTAVRQKVRIGAIVVVQTHGRSGHYNPHLHIIMSSGGINEETGKWVELGYFPYEIIHKKWQYHLFKMLKEMVATEGMKLLIDALYRKYPRGLVAHVTKGQVPERCRGLAKYLAKYVASPPIAIRRIISYTGQEVTYWYKDHQTKGIEVVTVDAMTFIGRMVQHILPKGFQRIRYYGLQATKTFQKWVEAIKEGFRKAGRAIQGVYEVVVGKSYRERYKEMSGRDPLTCRFCGREMALWKIWHPKHGTIYDELENIKAGRYEKTVEREGEVTGEPGGGGSLWTPSGGIQLSLLPVRV
jgi:hypothetical protein